MMLDLVLQGVGSCIPIALMSTFCYKIIFRKSGASVRKRVVVFGALNSFFGILNLFGFLRIYLPDAGWDGKRVILFSLFYFSLIAPAIFIRTNWLRKQASWLVVLPVVPTIIIITAPFFGTVGSSAIASGWLCVLRVGGGAATEGAPLLKA